MNNLLTGQSVDCLPIPSFRQFCQFQRGSSTSSISCDNFDIGQQITTITGRSNNWTTASYTSSISFTSTETELDLYFFICMQGSKSFTATPSCTGATMEILETPVDNGGNGKVWKVKLTGITIGSTVSLRVYTSYSAISGLGYIVI